MRSRRSAVRLALVCVLAVAAAENLAFACDQVCDPFPGFGGQCISTGMPCGSTCEQVGDTCFYTQNNCRSKAPAEFVAEAGRAAASEQCTQRPMLAAAQAGFAEVASQARPLPILEPAESK